MRAGSALLPRRQKERDRDKGGGKGRTIAKTRVRKNEREGREGGGTGRKEIYAKSVEKKISNVFRKIQK